MTKNIRKYYKGDFDRLHRRNMWFKNEKRKELVSKFAEKREKLKKEGNYEALDKLPKNASPVRLRNSCFIDGRNRGYIGKFGLCRHCLRKLASEGMLPGVKKASW